jgi:hypothetical protein
MIAPIWTKMVDADIITMIKSSSYNGDAERVSVRPFRVRS